MHLYNNSYNTNEERHGALECALSILLRSTLAYRSVLVKNVTLIPQPLLPLPGRRGAMEALSTVCALSPCGRGLG